jgi:CheY-like chemotaxis protein
MEPNEHLQETQPLPESDRRSSEGASQSAADKRRHFIAVLAHELRNPIAPIRSGLDLMTTGLLDEEARRSTLQMMQRQVTHLVRLIDDLLDTVRLDTGKLQVKRQPVVLSDILKSAIESIRPAIWSKSQALQLKDDAANVVIDADPVRLSQAFVNILSANAKATPEGGVVAVSVTSGPTELSIVFEDEGAGVDLATVDEIFEPFPASAARRSEDGVGIGLALVRGLVELNDGTIEVQNRAARSGAAYTVTLPLSPLDKAALARDDDETEPVWPSHRILIVDDNRDAAETLSLLFEFDGQTVRLAHDGPSAVAEAKEFQPAVILMDIGLPGFSGNEAIKRIRAQENLVHPFIIALTGWGAPRDRQATKDAGSDLHLVKPVSHDELRKVILGVATAEKVNNGLD